MGAYEVLLGLTGFFCNVGASIHDLKGLAFCMVTESE